MFARRSWSWSSGTSADASLCVDLCRHEGGCVTQNAPARCAMLGVRGESGGCRQKEYQHRTRFGLLFSVAKLNYGFAACEEIRGGVLCSIKGKYCKVGVVNCFTFTSGVRVRDTTRTARLTSTRNRCGRPSSCSTGVLTPSTGVTSKLWKPTCTMYNTVYQCINTMYLLCISLQTRYIVDTIQCIQCICVLIQCIYSVSASTSDTVDTYCTSRLVRVRAVSELRRAVGSWGIMFVTSDALTAVPWRCAGATLPTFVSVRPGTAQVLVAPALAAPSSRASHMQPDAAPTRCIAASSTSCTIICLAQP